MAVRASERVRTSRSTSLVGDLGRNVADASSSDLPGRCLVEQQHGPDRQRNTAARSRICWSRVMNMCVMECYYGSEPFDEAGVPRRGYRKRMYELWKQRETGSVSEQRLCDQARAIMKNGWLTNSELESIRRRGMDDVLSKENNGGVTQELEQGGGHEREQVNQQQEDWVRIQRNGMSDGSMNANVDIVVGDTSELSVEEKGLIDRLIQIVEDERNKTVKSFSYRSANQKKLSDEIVRMNRILEVLTMPSISVTNEVIRGVSMLVAENLGLRENVGGRRKEVEPWWKRRIKGDIKKISDHVSILDRKRRGELRKKQVYRLLVRKYKIDRKGLDVVLEELKQRVGAMRAKLKRYEARVKQYQQNRLFVMNQRKVYQELNGVEQNKTIVPDASESRKFWEGIWRKEKVHNREAVWLGEMKGEVNYEQQRELKIDRGMVGTQCKRMPNWKAAGPDGVQGFWIKRLSSLHNQIADQLNEIVSGEVDLPEWMTCGRTYLCVKDPKKGAVVENFRPITCLPLMWKLLTGMIAESMYSHLEKSEILPAEQKGCKKRSRGTKDQLLINKLVLKDCKRRHTNLAMAWVDYRKAAL